ncbi:MAG TPA: hypothetical protein VFP84_19435, partial [Kofleriaceae bacterium]|nr:hypothetical protein [Kofleriaceae bacterium]
VPRLDESFADLDVGYRRVGFWDRLRGRAPRPRDPSEESRPFRIPVAATPTEQPPLATPAPAPVAAPTTTPAEPAAPAVKPRKEHTTQRAKPSNKGKKR